MEHMLDQGTKDYFNEKFDNTNEKLDTVIATVDKIDGKVVEHDVRIAIVEKSQEDHITDHQEHKSTSQFSIGIWVMVAIFAIDKISAFIDRFLPFSP